MLLPWISSLSKLQRTLTFIVVSPHDSTTSVLPGALELSLVDAVVSSTGEQTGLGLSDVSTTAWKLSYESYVGTKTLRLAITMPRQKKSENSNLSFRRTDISNLYASSKRKTQKKEQLLEGPRDVHDSDSEILSSASAHLSDTTDPRFTVAPLQLSTTSIASRAPSSSYHDNNLALPNLVPQPISKSLSHLLHDPYDPPSNINFPEFLSIDVYRAMKKQLLETGKLPRLDSLPPPVPFEPQPHTGRT
ncbi:hypothetical protein D9757_007210 [Collybiopsis confluens]|uniref:Uncharacterized protein n=1 Tax=Collybiopsis confluens TaxID=2823264 RepID=A0A8H5M3H9_9AGAR|nr:hypothetical protein D9757_007210 [Collybiopsis confluens]